MNSILLRLSRSIWLSLGMSVALATGVLAATLDTSATLSTALGAPTEVGIGSNSFEIKVWATGNLNADPGLATVVNRYVMATNGTITPDTSSTTQLTFAKRHYGDTGVEMGCNTTPVPLGCKNNPHIVNATLVVSSGTPDGRDGTLVVSTQGSPNLDRDPNPATGYVEVQAPPPPSDTTPPVITPNVVGTLGNNGWYTSDVTVSWSVVDNESAISSSNGCGSTIINSDTAGTTLTCTATSAGGTNSQSVTIKRDASAPSASLAVTAGTPGANGWYTSDVTVSTSGSDSVSDVVSCTADQYQTTETTGAVFNGSCTNGAGLVGNAVPLTVKLDKTAPSASLAVTAGTLGNDGWYISDVTVSTSGSDSISGPVICTGPQSLTADSAGTTFNGSCTNDAGLSTNAAPLTIKRDATPPTKIGFVGGPGGGGEYYFRSVPAAPTCTADGAISGLASCVVTGYSNAVGSHTLTATATDNAGNQATAQLSYTVLAWALSGFYQPVEMTPAGAATVWNTVKGGATVPLKFEVFAGATELTDTGVVSTFTKQVACFSGVEDAVDLVATGGTSLRYDTTTGQFVFNWQTPKQPGKCYEVKLTTQDGSSIAAYFKLK